MSAETRRLIDACWEVYRLENYEKQGMLLDYPRPLAFEVEAEVDGRWGIDLWWLEDYPFSFPITLYRGTHIDAARHSFWTTSLPYARAYAGNFTFFVPENLQLKTPGMTYMKCLAHLMSVSNSRAMGWFHTRDEIRGFQQKLAGTGGVFRTTMDAETVTRAGLQLFVRAQNPQSEKYRSMPGLSLLDRVCAESYVDEFAFIRPDALNPIEAIELWDDRGRLTPVDRRTKLYKTAAKTLATPTKTTATSPARDK